MLRPCMAPRASTSATKRVPPAPETLRLRFTVPSTNEGIRTAVRRVIKAAVETRCLRSARADVEIALWEALSNAAFHGNHGDASKTVRVRCTLSAERGITVGIRDDGNGFDPARIPDPRKRDRLFLHHGRGLLLMRALMDRVEHRHEGREVVLHKAPRGKRPAPAPRPRAVAKAR